MLWGTNVSEDNKDKNLLFCFSAEFGTEAHLSFSFFSLTQCSEAPQLPVLSSLSCYSFNWSPEPAVSFPQLLVSPAAIPVRFRQPLSDVRCAEAGDAEFQCVLCTPCHEPLWLHKSHPLQASDKHQISVTPDGLTHKLIVKNVVPSDSGLYTLDAGQGSSSAWLLVDCEWVAAGCSHGVLAQNIPLTA